MLNKKQSEEQTKDQHVRELESALEEVRSTFFFSQIWFLFVLVWRKRWGLEELTSTFCCHRFLFVVWRKRWGQLCRFFVVSRIVHFLPLGVHNLQAHSRRLLTGQGQLTLCQQPNFSLETLIFHIVFIVSNYLIPISVFQNVRSAGPSQALFPALHELSLHAHQDQLLSVFLCTWPSFLVV